MADDTLWPVYTETVTVLRYMVAAPTQKAAEARMADLLAGKGGNLGVTYMRQVRSKEMVKPELDPCAQLSPNVIVFGRCTRLKGHQPPHANENGEW